MIGAALMACHYWNNSGRTDTLVWVIFSKCMSWKSLDIGTASLLQTSQWNFKVLWFKCLHVSLEELNFPLLSPNACQSITNFWSGDQLSKSHHKVWVDGSGTWRCWFHFLIFLYDREKKSLKHFGLYISPALCQMVVEWHALSPGYFISP